MSENSLNILVMLVLVMSLIAGIFIGIFIHKIKSKFDKKREIKYAKEVLEGKRDNVLEIEGVKYKANKFRVRNDNGQEEVIILGDSKEEVKGGNIINNATEKENNIQNEAIGSQDIIDEIIREDSNSPRKKKRTLRKRNGKRRFF